MSRPDLKRGSRGHAVGALQTFLASIGLYTGRIDKDFGLRTDAAVRAYQKLKGLKSDGWVSTKTWATIPDDSEPDLVPASPFPPMSPAKRAKIFGSFDYEPTYKGDDSIIIHGGWEARNISKFYIPQLDGVPLYSPDNHQKCSGFVRLHNLAGPIFQRFLERVEDEGHLHLVRTFDGGHNARFVRGSKTALSNHAWGTAIDMNAYANGLGKEPAAKGEDGYLIPLVRLAYECGIYWGGNFSRKDGMHFEIAIT